MTDRTPDGFDPIDPFERQLVRGVQAWTDQAAGPEDAAEIARVARSGVRSRFRPAPSGGRGPLLVTMALAAAAVIGVLMLRPTLPDTTLASLPPGATLSAAATDGGNVIDPSLPAIPPASAGAPTAAPSLHPHPTPTRPPAVTPTPTPKPATKTPRPDPGPTDAPEQTWSPPDVFTSVLRFVDYCWHAPSAMEQVFVRIEWSSPVRITEVLLWIDGEFKGVTWFASGSGSEGEYEAIHSTTYEFQVGTAHTFSAQFKAGSDNVTGQLESPQFTVPQGDPCPTG